MMGLLENRGRKKRKTFESDKYSQSYGFDYTSFS